MVVAIGTSVSRRLLFLRHLISRGASLVRGVIGLRLIARKAFVVELLQALSTSACSTGVLFAPFSVIKAASNLIIRFVLHWFKQVACRIETFSFYFRRLFLNILVLLLREDW